MEIKNIKSLQHLIYKYQILDLICISDTEIKTYEDEDIFNKNIK